MTTHYGERTQTSRWAMSSRTLGGCTEVRAIGRTELCIPAVVLRLWMSQESCLGCVASHASQPVSGEGFQGDVAPELV